MAEKSESAFAFSIQIYGSSAGLSVAYQLARKGHAVTIFDERKETGGMMRYGIPGFRTPREVLDPFWTDVRQEYQTVGATGF